ncbi:phosphate-starvation-inducible protein PsiE [Ferrimonas lipolytica]|uniref:Protein PsiE n=1 Tax=Ferrimonas lipolytica TaxID=2724191 RepID=A0A6H1UD45_9GAMM|nr:phosphate-starvation-inducible PsiE family protein [Ferrimonas lipolytica]QIZ77005.1 phosphate-starvation-inducible PsiE family protein [Ferrimonas lipolytica]
MLNRKYGLKLIKYAEAGILVLIAIATLFAIGEEVKTVWQRGHVILADLLLLFIYLEVLAMVANYAEIGKLPIRMPVYIAIVALARYLILDMKAMDDWRIIAIASAALVLALTVQVIRYGQIKLPYPEPGQRQSDD